MRLFFRARGLPRKAPYQVVFHMQGDNFVQGTEFLNEDEPVFKKPALAAFSFARIQRVSICLRHRTDRKDYSMAKAKLGDIIGSRNSTLAFSLPNGAEVVVRAEHFSEDQDYQVTKTIRPLGEDSQQVRELAVRESVRLSLQGHKLFNTDSKFDFINKSDPFFRLLKVGLDGSTAQCYESEVIRNTLEPKWKTVAMPLPSLVIRESGKPFVIQVWDDNHKKKPEFIGEVSVYLKDIKPKSRN